MFNRLKFCGTETAHDAAVHGYTTSAFQFICRKTETKFLHPGQRASTF